MVRYVCFTSLIEPKNEKEKTVEQLKGLEVSHFPNHIFCNNSSVTDIFKTPVQHSKMKHLDIHHHFIRDLVEKRTVVIDYVATEKQLADIFIKPLDALRFDSLRKSLGICVI